MSIKEQDIKKQINEICIGIIAYNIGVANQGKVIKAGNAIFDYISKMTYKQFKAVKGGNHKTTGR